MSNQPKLINLLVDSEDTQNKVLQSVSAIEIAGGILITNITKQLDPVSNTYKIISESSTFLAEYYAEDDGTGNYIFKKR